MSVKIQSLNSDSSFLFTFSPPFCPVEPRREFPGSFTILIDPWLSGPSTLYAKAFAITEHTEPASINSLADLPDPNLIVISQDKPDHCHAETLLQLPRDTNATILGTAAAAKKIRSWKHFDPESVKSLRRYDHRRDHTVHRFPIPPYSENGSPGEVTVALLAPKHDITGLHNAIGITYRPPSSVLTFKVNSYLSLPYSPPDTPSERSDSTSLFRPATSSSSTCTSTTVYPSPLSHGLSREKTMSLLYSPHGVDYSIVKPYASGHLLAEAALPLTVLFHSFDRTSNPWFLGGNLIAGGPGGAQIAQALFAKTWVSAHDEEKTSSGVSVLSVKTVRYDVDDIRRILGQLDDDNLNVPKLRRSKNRTDVRILKAGDELTLMCK